tara:strand:- start:47 stop:220 length:174 start_codon:yes stop_codon:yes gene_type:complete
MLSVGLAFDALPCMNNFAMVDDAAWKLAISSASWSLVGCKAGLKVKLPSGVVGAVEG